MFGPTLSGQDTPLDPEAGRYVSGPIAVPAGAELGAVEIVFRGVEHADASFEGRVFVNNPAANEQTEKTAENGYAGSFHVFGFGGLAADTGEGAEGGARLPGDQVVKADERALRTALAEGRELTVTVVPVPSDPAPEGLPEPLVGTVSIVFG